jgi:hypothetical protein
LAISRARFKSPFIFSDSSFAFCGQPINQPAIFKSLNVIRSLEGSAFPFYWRPHKDAFRNRSATSAPQQDEAGGGQDDQLCFHALKVAPKGGQVLIDKTD